MVLVLATSATQLRELDSTIAVFTVALLIALIFHARFFEFRRHHASEPRLIVGLMGALATGFSLGEGAALLGMLASDPRLLTRISATGLVLLFALVLTLVFELWLEGLRKHARGGPATARSSRRSGPSSGCSVRSGVLRRWRSWRCGGCPWGERQQPARAQPKQVGGPARRGEAIEALRRSGSADCQLWLRQARRRWERPADRP